MSVPAPRPALPQSPPLPRRYLAIALALVLLAAAAGWGLRALSAGPAVPAPKPPREITAGLVSLTVPGEWASERAALADVPNLPAGTAAFAPMPGLRAHVLVLRAPIDDPSLVAAPLRALASTPLGRPRVSSLAGMSAWTYPDVPVAGDRVLEVTVAPTTRGVLTVACLARSLSWLGAAGCAADIGEASVAGASSLRPSPEFAYGTVLPGVIERLGDRRAHLRARLRGATTRRGQSRFAARLGRAHARAGARLAPWAPSGGPARGVDRALRATSRGYGRLSAAARHGWPKRYRMARRAVRRGDAALKRALAKTG